MECRRIVRYQITRFLVVYSLSLSVQLIFKKYCAVVINFTVALGISFQKKSNLFTNKDFATHKLLAMPHHTGNNEEDIGGFSSAESEDEIANPKKNRILKKSIKQSLVKDKISELMSEIFPVNDQQKYILLLGKNKKLQSQVHKEVTASKIEKCLQLCLYDNLCLSFNALKLLNNIGFECSFMNTIGSLSQNLIQSTGFNYYEVNQCYPCHIIQDNNGQFCDCRQIGIERDCVEWLAKGYRMTGLYKIDVNFKQIDVYCDMITDGGGWIKFQNRFDGSENFFTYWDDYRNGFGSITGEFWLGNEVIHEVTTSVVHELRVDTMRFGNKTNFAQYSEFRLEAEDELYALRFNICTKGTIGHLTSHNGLPFTTRDRDNDNHPSRNCGIAYPGAWWFTSCFGDHLNGKWWPYYNSGNARGIHFFDGHGISYKKASMMMRRTSV